MSLITGRAFMKALTAAGVLHDDDRVSRVVIDAQLNSAVAIYVERYGDTRLLQVATTLEGVEIRTVEGQQVSNPVSGASLGVVVSGETAGVNKIIEDRQRRPV